MKDSVKFNTSQFKKIGTVSVSMYKEINTNKPIFSLQLDNEDMLQVSYAIEDILKMF